MAYILTPRFAPAYQSAQCNPFGYGAPPPQSSYGYRTVQRVRHQPQSCPSPFASFFSQLEDLVSEIDVESRRQAQVEAQREAQRAAQLEAQRESYRAHIEAQRAAYHQRQAQIEAHIDAQREAHRQRQLRKRTLGAKFAATQNEQGWQIDAEVPGFEQESISIEFTDENTLRVSGNTEWGAKAQEETQAGIEAASAVEQTVEETSEQSIEKMTEGINLEPEVVTAAAATESTQAEHTRPASPDSDTSSQKSYQATVEDEFEDLGPEASSLFPTPSQPLTPNESKGKEKTDESSVGHREIIEDPEVSVPETAVMQQSQPDVSAHEEEARLHGSFERKFRFPARIDISNVRASFKGGVLSISVPRAQSQQVRKIAIL